MPTKHCRACQPDKPCGNSHVYVIELRPEVAEGLANRSYRGYLYVGSTSKSVEERLRDTFSTKDGTEVSREEARTHEDEFQWNYGSPSSRRVRKHFLKFRPDLFYGEINPVERSGKDLGAAERRERKLADKLRNRRWYVWGPTNKPKGAGDKVGLKGTKKR